MKKESKQKKDGENREKQEKELRLSTAIYSLFLAALFAVIFFAVLIFVFNIENQITEKAAFVVPYPAALAGSSVITVAELHQKMESVRNFYENQDFSEIASRVDFESQEGKKRLKIKEKYLLEKLIENRIIEKKAKEAGIKLTKEMVSQEVKRKMDQYGSQKSLSDDLGRLYGWDISDFEENIVRPDMYKEKLLAHLRQNDKSYEKARQKAEEAKGELDGKMDFREAVRKYSEGESAQKKGELGWFSPEEMLLEISEAVFSLDKDQTSGIIESPLGYHIVLVEDKKKEDDVEKIKLSQIFVRTMTIGDWLEEYKKEISIKIFLRDFYWNEKEARVDFSNPEMVEFERETEKNSEGDISVMF